LWLSWIVASWSRVAVVPWPWAATWCTRAVLTRASPCSAAFSAGCRPPGRRAAGLGPRRSTGRHETRRGSAEADRRTGTAGRGGGRARHRPGAPRCPRGSPRRRRAGGPGSRSSRSRCSRSALAEVDVLPDRPGQAQRAQRLEDEGQGRPGWSVRPRPRPSPPCTAGGPGSSRGRLRGGCAPGGALCRSARFTAVSSLTIVQSSW